MLKNFIAVIRAKSINRITNCLWNDFILYKCIHICKMLNKKFCLEIYFVAIWINKYLKQLEIVLDKMNISFPVNSRRTTHIYLNIVAA